MLKDKFSSSNILNYIFFLLIIGFNIFFYFEREFEYYFIFLVLINIYFIVIFFWFNLKHDYEFHQSSKNIKKLMKEDSINNYTKEILKSKINFKDNKEIFSLFKNTFIKKNLLKKDYNDFKETFLKFIPEPFVNEIGRTGMNKIKLGLSVKKYLNVVFLDIIGFTGMAERIPKEKTLLLLNVYFNGIVEIIKKYGGYVDKFLGDGMMIIFDSKISDNILNASIEIHKFIDKIKLREETKAIEVGIGINSGEVILGTVGSKNRMEITIIGDVVNTASRIEGFTRGVNYNIIMSEETYKNIKNKNNFHIEEIGYEKLKGKEIEIKLYGMNFDLLKSREK